MTDRRDAICKNLITGKPIDQTWASSVSLAHLLDVYNRLAIVFYVGGQFH